MRKATVIEFFGGVTETAEALGISRQAVDKWPKRLIPERSALLAQARSDGFLKYDPEAYKRRRQSIGAKQRAGLSPS